MKVRLAALITACAAAFLWYAEPLKSEDLAGICVSSKKPRSDVIAACTTLIEDQNTTPEYRHLFLTERAWSHSCDNRYERAIADVDQALELQPDNYKTWVLRARIHAANKNHDAAKLDYDKAVELGPQASFTHWKRARYLDQQGRDEDAFQGYERVLELNPDADNAAKYMANHLFNNKEYDKALRIVEAALEQWPDRKWVYDRRIELDIVYTKDVASALAASESAINLDQRGHGPVLEFI